MLQPISWDEAVEIVQQDVNAVMQERVPSGDIEGSGFAPGAPFTDGSPPPTINGGDPIEVRPLSDESQTIHVVPWAWTGVDTVGLFELGPTNERVTIHGVTFVTNVEARDDSGGYQLYRYVDWLDVFAQAGISIATRPIVDIVDAELLEENPELREAYDMVAEREGREPRSAF